MVSSSIRHDRKHVVYSHSHCPSVHVGDKSAAIDFYSKAVTELENGVSCTVNVKGQCHWGIQLIVQ